MTSFDRRTKWILTMAFFSLCAIVYGLVIPSSNKNSSQSQFSAGKIVNRTNDVRRKAEQDVAWNQIPNQEKVYSLDHIFTGDQSSAEIELKTGAKLTMNSNSLIVLKDQTDRSQVKLSTGGFISRLRKGEKFDLLKNNKVIQIKAEQENATIQVSQNQEDSDLGITVLSGQLQVEDKGTVTELKKNEKLVVTQASTINDDNPISLTSVAEVMPAEVKQETPPVEIKTDPVRVEVKPIPVSPKKSIIQRKIANEDSVKKPVENKSEVIVPAKAEPVALPVPAPLIPALSVEPIDDQKVWMSLGLGVNYLRYTQSVPNSSELKFQSLESPTVFLNAGSMVSENWGLDMSYKDSPGSLQSSSTINVLNTKYKWKTFSFEGLYQQESLQLRYGLQQHFIPFMTSNTNGDVLIREHNLSMLTAGFNYFFGRGKRVRHVLGLRYQYPIAQGSGGSETFSIKPKFAFDGQIGQEFFLTKKIFLGFYWYGQWHDYDFLFQNGTQLDSGHQSLFFSTIDARIGFEF